MYANRSTVGQVEHSHGVKNNFGSLAEHAKKLFDYVLVKESFSVSV